MSLSHNLQQIRQLVDNIEQDLQDTPNIENVRDLLDACMVIEEYYQDFCAQCDRQFDDPDGTTYAMGINLEFYIEADWWHDVSLALRQLTKTTNG